VDAALKARTRNRLAALAALLLIAPLVFALEYARWGVETRALTVGTTPATLYQRAESTGPVVVVAHGFAGSRQIMQAYSLRLARAGYRVLAYDLEGHGRNPRPMSGDVTVIEGTTALLVAETRRVIAAARALPDVEGLALLGHSMATDILVRAALAEAEGGTPVQAIVAISLFSQAVTATEPANLLAISGQGEGALRAFALNAAQQVDPNVCEGELALSGQMARMAVVAPWVEHVGVLYSPTAVRAARDWLDRSFDRQSGAYVGQMGLWVLGLMAAIVLVVRPLSRLLPQAPALAGPSRGRFLLASLAPMIAVPVILTPLYANFLPVLVADYLMLHLALFGALQLALLGGIKARLTLSLAGVALLVLAGIGALGLALDRYAASFWPTSQRWPIIAILCLGTIPFMVADAHVTGAGRGALWRRVLARVAVIASLGIAGAIDPENLLFVLIVLPVFVLFFLVHGLMGRWVAQRAGATTAGLGLGLCLAWALGVSFPLFTP